MDLNKRLSNLKMNLEKNLINNKPEILFKYPIEEYIKLINEMPPVADYKYLSDDIKLFYSRILSDTNAQILNLYHQLLIVELINKAMQSSGDKKITDDIDYYYFANFERIIGQIEKNTNEDDFYLYPNDKFFKDLGVCSLRIIPAGAQKINITTLPKAFLLRNGIHQFLKGINYIIFELGGIKPIFDMHTDSHDPLLMKEFNFDGWKQFYLRVSCILKDRIDIRGIFGAGWVFDPQLVTVSPRLSYLREIVTSNGGALFYMGTSEHGLRNSLAKSETRRRLYHEGKYVPKDYMVIWSRNAMINWANKQALVDNQIN